MWPELEYKLPRILVMRLDNIGDVVMLSPALRALRRQLPQAQITLMASPAGSQVVPLLPWIDDVFTYRTVWQDASGAMPHNPARELELVQTLRQRNFDAAFIFTSFSQSAWPPAYVCYLAGIPVRIGQSKEFGGSLLTHWIKSLPDAAHQVDRNLHLLTASGFREAGIQLELHIPEAVQDKTDRLLAGFGLAALQPFILIAPGASCPARRYDPVRFGEVAGQLQALTKLPVVVVGSEKEKPLVQSVLESAGRDGNNRQIIGLAGQLDIPQLAALIRRAHLVIANDSGPMHIADAFQRPLIVLYSGTELESQWQPRNSPARILRRPTECSPCYRFQCPYNMECLDIPAGEVVSQAQVLLSDVLAHGKAAD